MSVSLCDCRRSCASQSVSLITASSNQNVSGCTLRTRDIINLWRVYLEFFGSQNHINAVTVVLGRFHLQVKRSKSEEQQLHSVNIPVSFFS